MSVLEQRPPHRVEYLMRKLDQHFPDTGIRKNNQLEDQFRLTILGSLARH